MSARDKTLLIGLGAPFRRDDQGRLLVEAQTVSGLQAWQKHFARVIGYAICLDGPVPAGYSRADESGLVPPAFELVPLPDTYNRNVYRSQRSKVERTMHDLMQRADFDVFSYGGWLGDPGEIAASVARRERIPHAVWLDRVESQVVLAEGRTPLQRIKAKLKSLVIARNERRALRGAELGMLHGTTVFDHFKAIARTPVKIEDIHLSQSDRIDPDALKIKKTRCLDGPLQILYCGRAAPMKGGFDWLKVLHGLSERGVDFQATWLGDGPDLEAMKRQAGAFGLLPDKVTFPGFVVDRDAVKAHYRDAQVLLFCHLTDESPRNLIESLHLATPLVGYRDGFSEGLVGECGAGTLVPRGDTGALVDAVAALASDRTRLADLITRAAKSAADLTREQVFKHRSDIVADHLSRD